MTGFIYIIALALMGQVGAGVVELNCSDNATCIDHMAAEFIRSIKHHKTVRLFDVLTIEPIRTRQARSNQGPLTRLLTSHALSFDWSDFTFRFSNPENRDDALDLDVFENRSAKDDSELASDEEVENKLPRNSNKIKSVPSTHDVQRIAQSKRIKKRRSKRKMLHAVIPLMFGMKSTGAVIFALAMVTAITVKAYIASKLALFVTAGMAMRKLYDSYTNGVGLPNQPYLYSQYPIDFPSASSHAYSVSGVNSQFASPEMFNPTAIAAQTQTQELLHQNDVSAQSSQQAPTLLLNSTRAATERWDGKSKLLKFFEPIIGSIKKVMEPITNAFYAMPATFRGLNSDVMATTGIEANKKEKNKRENLIAQPRFIAQRKMNSGKAPRVKKYSDLKVSLERLKQNKDLHDYVKTKKYKFNYPNTFYYPRVNYVINPNTYTVKPNNSRLTPHRKESKRQNATNINHSRILVKDSNDWTPITEPVLNIPSIKKNATKKTLNDQRKHTRVKRNVHGDTSDENNKHFRSYDNHYFISRQFNSGYSEEKLSGRSLFTIFEFLFDPVSTIVKHTAEYTKIADNSLKKKDPPNYYSLAYNLLMYSLDIIAGIFDIGEEIKNNYIVSGTKTKTKKKSKQKDKTKSKIEVMTHV